MQGLSYEHLRARTGLKWTKHGPDVLNSWVADMDFDPAPQILQAVKTMLDRGDFGYSFQAADQLPAAYADWQDRHHSWRPDEERIRSFTSVLHALETVLWANTNPGDGVVVFTPIYYPFLKAIEESSRRLVDVPLEPGSWRIDPDLLASSIDDTTKLVLFCHPHNPTGRVFDNEEVAALASVAERHDLLIITDEIWGDITHGATHRPLATMDERFAGRLVTLGSASKTFNLAGARCAVAHIDHQPTTQKLAEMPGHLLGAVSSLGAQATLTAWTECDTWQKAMAVQLTERRDHLIRRLGDDLPEVTITAPEATYLGWLNFRAAALGDDPAEVLFDEAQVAIEQGLKFGPQGAGFARINYATSEAILDDIIDRIVACVRSKGVSTK